MFFARVQGRLCCRRLVLKIAAMQLLVLGLASAQNPPTVTTLTVTPSAGQETAVTSGTVITLIAAVTAGGKPLTQGQVTFCDATVAYCTDIHLLSTAQLTSTGTAIIRLVPGVGSHSYQAVFAGTTNLAPSTSTPAVATVTGTYPTTTSLAASGVPGNYTLGATVVSAGGTIPPTGDVSFFDTTNADLLLATQPLVPNSTHVTWNTIVEPTANELTTFVTGDFNGDGKADLLYPSVGQPNQLQVLFGNGDGTFTPAAKGTSIGANASGMVVADFNGDGRQDVAVFFNFEQTNNLSIFLGNGDGSFTPAATTTLAIGLANFVVGDFNGDGNEDLAVSSGDQLNILFGNGDGTFTVGPPTAASFVNFAVGDFNKDGKLDIVYAGQQLTILLGNGDGTFDQGVSLPGANYPVVADFNGDGILDIAGSVAVQDPDGPMDDGYVSVYLGAGDGSFTEAAKLNVLRWPRSIVVGDFNRDGKPDLAVANFDDNSDSTFLGNGDGTFTPVGTLSAGEDPATTLVAADFNGDGATDLAVTWTGVMLALNVSQPTMTSVATASGITLVGTGTHMVVANYLGDGPYTPSVSTPLGLTPLTNPTPARTALTLSASPASSTTFGQQVTLTATLSPYTAQGKTTDGETVTFYSGRYPLGSAILHSGIASVPLGTIPVGADSLTATYSGDETFVGSTSGALEFTVGGPAPAPTTSLKISADGRPVATVAAGKAVTLTANVLIDGTPLASSGTFNFCEASAPYCTDVHVLGTAQVTAAGTGSFKFVPGIGVHSYKAAFLPTANYAGSSSSPAQLTVAGSFPTTTTLAATGSDSDYTLTATTTGFVNVPGLLSPTGTVTFVDTSNQNSTVTTSTLGNGSSAINIAALRQVPVGHIPFALASGDFNGDGIVDLAVNSDTDNALTVLLGNGDGTFRQGVNPAMNAAGIAAGDLNGDGICDLVVTDGYNPMTVLLGVGDGTFTVLPVPSVTNAFGPVIADFNGDGILDVVILTGPDDMLGATPTVQVLLGNGDGTFRTGQNLITHDPNSAEIQVTGPMIVGDFNGDGKPDLAVPGFGLSPPAILLGNGDGTFTLEPPNPVAMTAVFTSADFNGDGKSDLFGGEPDGTFAVWLSNGDGTFTAVRSSITAATFTQGAVAADFNHDGFADVATTVGSSSVVSILLGHGDGTLTQSATGSTAALYAPAAADVNGDGLPDILVPNNANADTVSVFLTQLAQTTTSTVTGISYEGVNNQAVTAAYPGDTNYQGSTSGPVTLMSQPLPTGMVIQPNPATTSTYGQPVTLTATLHPYFTPVHSSDGEVVTFTQAGNVIGTGLLSGGVATLTVSTLPVGSYDLIASFAGENYLAATSSNRRFYTVTAAAPTITFSIPNHTYGDAPFPVTATSNSGGAITYTVVSGPATVNGSTVRLNGTGTVTILASQAASEDYLAGTQQATFSVAARAQTINFVAPPTPVKYGAAPIPLTASATSGLPVTFRIVSGPGVVSGATLSLTGAGTVVVAADQKGNADYLAAAKVAQSIVVSKVAVAGVGLSAAPNPAVVQVAVTFTATVSSPLSTPSGSVVFSDGGSLLGTSTLTKGVAALTLSTLTAGQHAITAAYGGDANFAPSDSAAVVETLQDFQVTSGAGNPPSQTIQPGGTASYALSFSPQGGSTFPDAVSLTATGLPTGAVASFSPQTVPAGAGTTNVTLTIQSPAQAALMKLNRVRGRMFVEVALACVLLPFAGRQRLMNRRFRLFCMGLMLVLGAVSLGGTLGCGGSGNGGSSASGQAAQTYDITVTATSGHLSHTVTVTFTVD